MSGISLAQEFTSHLLLSRRGNVTALILMMDSFGCWVAYLVGVPPVSYSPPCYCIWFCCLYCYSCLIFHVPYVHTWIIKSRWMRIFGNSKLWILHASEADDFSAEKKTYGIYSHLYLQRLVGNCEEGEVYNFAIMDGRSRGESSAGECPDSGPVSCLF